jgi:hypothetical protein
MDRNTTPKKIFSVHISSILLPAWWVLGSLWPPFCIKVFWKQPNKLVDQVGGLSFRLVPQMLKNATEEAKLYTSVGWLLLLGNNRPGRLLTRIKGTHSYQIHCRSNTLDHINLFNYFFGNNILLCIIVENQRPS